MTPAPHAAGPTSDLAPAVGSTSSRLDTSAPGSSGSLAAALIAGDRAALGRAITLVESRHAFGTPHHHLKVTGSTTPHFTDANDTPLRYISYPLERWLHVLAVTEVVVNTRSEPPSSEGRLMTAPLDAASHLLAEVEHMFTPVGPTT